MPERAGGRLLWAQVFSFSIDRHGDLYAANNTSSFFRFRPTNAECSHYFRVWGAELEGEGRNASGICSTGERVFALYMTASIPLPCSTSTTLQASPCTRARQPRALRSARAPHSRPDAQGPILELARTGGQKLRVIRTEQPLSQAAPPPPPPLPY